MHPRGCESGRRGGGARRRSSPRTRPEAPSSSPAATRNAASRAADSRLARDLARRNSSGTKMAVPVSAMKKVHLLVLIGVLALATPGLVAADPINIIGGDLDMMQSFWSLVLIV